MIKAAILDVDGIIVGDKKGVNFPHPTKAVIQKLREVRKKGIPLILCTAKFAHPIKDITYKAELNNPHISDGGAFIFNPIDKIIIKKHVFKKSVVEKFLTASLGNGASNELFTADGFYVQKDYDPNFLKKRIHVLLTEPIIVESLIDVAKKEDVIKILSFVENKNEKFRVEEVVKQFKDQVNFIWSSHPYLFPSVTAVITAPNVSKAHAAKEAIKSLNLSFDEILGIGDTESDWNFMSLCKYVATVSNAPKKLLELVKTKGEGNYFIGPTVDEDGIIHILDYFLKERGWLK